MSGLTLKDLISTLNLKDLNLTLKDLKCSNTGYIPGTWISVKVVGKTDVLDKSIATVIGNRVLKISIKHIVLKFYYVDENNNRKYITFNKNCQMIYDDDGTPVEVDESVNENPVFIEETEISDEEFQELMKQSPLPVKTKPVHIEETEISDEEFMEQSPLPESVKTEGGKKRRSSHKKRRSSHKKRRSSHKKRRSSHKKRRH
jgi:hypothetical protein